MAGVAAGVGDKVPQGGEAGVLLGAQLVARVGLLLGDEVILLHCVISLLSLTKRNQKAFQTRLMPTTMTTVMPPTVTTRIVYTVYIYGMNLVLQLLGSKTHMNRAR